MFGLGLVCKTGFSEILGWKLCSKELIWQAMICWDPEHSKKSLCLEGLVLAENKPLILWSILPYSIVCIPESLCHPVSI